MHKFISMKKIYLALAIIGFIAPNILVFAETLETGNILLYTNPAATMSGMFDNRISTIFMIDLLFAVIVFFYWTYQESGKTGRKKMWLTWILTLLFGLAGGLPLFLYFREKDN